MHCDQCGKENRSGGKFCRHCGSVLLGSESSETKAVTQKFSWKNPVIILIIGLIILVGLSFGGYKAYAYFAVQSKISTAKKLQNSGDFSGSLSILNNLSGSSLTSGQQATVNAIQASDQKFVTFKASFDAAVALEGASPTSSDLQTALKDLQSIDVSYPLYKNVQTEITNVQSSLVTMFQSDASVSKKAAANAESQAAASATAKARAEEQAQQAQSEANSAAQTAANNQAQQVDITFVNALQSAYNDYNSNALTNYNNGINDLNAGSDSVALILFAKTNAADQSASDAATDLNNNYTNMPSTYTAAAYDLGEAAYYLTQASNSAISSMDSSYDVSATTNSDSAQSKYYRDLLLSFLSNPN